VAAVGGDGSRAVTDREVVQPEEAPPARVRGIGLSGKLLILTILFVMVGEVLIYVPSIANFRRNWLADRLNAAQTAALALEAAPDNMVPKALELELLAHVGAYTVAHKRGTTRRLLAISDMPPEVQASFDLRQMSIPGEIRDSFATLAAVNGRTIRVIGDAPAGGEFIEMVMDEMPLRHAMIGYSVNILTLSIIISVLTAALVYLTLNWLLVRPMRRLTANMVAFTENPEDASRVIRPSGRTDEIGVAEGELAHLQRALIGTLIQKNRLAALGLAVSKINHDLRNMLASAQLVVDRVGEVEDPLVQRLAPKLIRTLDRAVEFCTNTLKYGSAQELPPQRRRIALAALIDDVGDTLELVSHPGLRFVNAVPADLQIDADPDQMFRVMVNLARNALQAIEGRGEADASRDMIRVSARRDGAVVAIEVADTGPGLSEKARKRLFEAFQGSTRPGGTGLGLAISAELVRAHGGTIRLAEGTLGATFSIEIPDRIVELKARDEGRRRTG
jgi:signal transduction histidine kinase